MQVAHIVGARPNFMKLAPVFAACAHHGLEQSVLHTGQHYDDEMSEVFFRDLKLPAPDLNLEVESGSHAIQTAQAMVGIEGFLERNPPDWVLVYGDVNSTLAGALVCAKLRLPLAHVEAGLRSFDRSMPEEINRIVTDQLADLLFTPSEDAGVNLSAEGISSDRVRFVGNVMIDTLVSNLPRARNLRPADRTLPFALVTLHRPSNVDNTPRLREILETLIRLADKLDVIFPVHPRTRRWLGEVCQDMDLSDLRMTGPMSYLEFLSLEEVATVIITDSGGVQEEATFLGVPCLTIREATERPVTESLGTNVVVGPDFARLEREVNRILAHKFKRGQVPPLWDGHAGARVVNALLRFAQ